MRYLYSSKGFAHIFLIIFLLISIPLGLYLISHPETFKPKANEGISVRVVDNLRRIFPEGKANTLFVYLEVNPPTWEGQGGSSQEGLMPWFKQASAADLNPNPEKEYTTSFRVSSNLSKLDTNTPCELTGDPETNCKEISVINPSKNYYVSWTLPKKEDTNYIFVKFFSNKGRTKITNTSISYLVPGEIGLEVPTILIGGQALATTLVDALRKIPGTAAFNAAAELIYRVHSAGEQIVTLSHLQQLGLDMDLVRLSPRQVQFRYDQSQLNKLDLSIEFFPEPDPITDEARIQINPTVSPNTQLETAEATLNIALGEFGGRVIGSLVKKAATKIAETKGFQLIKTKITGKNIKIGEVLPDTEGSLNDLLNYNIDTVYIPLIKSGKAFVVDDDLTRPLMVDLLASIKKYQGGLLKATLTELDDSLELDIMKIIERNRVIAVADNVFSERFGTMGGFEQSGVVVVRESLIDDPFLFRHEFVHVIADHLKPFSMAGITFYYDQEQAHIYGSVMSQIFELSTDLVVRELYGGGEVYKFKYPKLYLAINGLIEEVIARSQGSISRMDFMRFALTYDDETLIKKVSESISRDEFLALIQKHIDTVKLIQLLPIKVEGVGANIKGNAATYAGSGLVGGVGGTFLSDYLASRSKGQVDPKVDIIIDYPDHDEDISP